MSDFNKYLVGALMCLGMAVMEIIKEEEEPIKIQDFNFDGFLKHDSDDNQVDDKK